MKIEKINPSLCTLPVSWISGAMDCDRRCVVWVYHIKDTTNFSVVSLAYLPFLKSFTQYAIMRPSSHNVFSLSDAFCDKKDALGIIIHDTTIEQLHKCIEAVMPANSLLGWKN